MRATMRRMGVMESAVALRSDDADEVVDVLLSILRGLGCRVHPDAGADAVRDEGRYDVRVTRSGPGWVVVRPHYVVPPDKLAVELTRRLQVLASAVMIYEDVLWSHWLVDGGEVLDRYVNLPGYFGPGEYDDSWQGDPGLVARSLGIEASEIAPYFRQVSVRRARSRLLPPIKAHRSDTHTLLDGWVVTELWRRMGIRWPDPYDGIRVPIGDDGTTLLSEGIRGY
jgi:hypothetical protein